MRSRRIFGVYVACVGALSLACATSGTATQEETPAVAQEVELKYFPPEARGQGDYRYVWSIFEQNVARKNPQTGDEAARWIAILESMEKENPGHPDLPKVRAELARLREIERKHPRMVYEMLIAPNSWARINLPVFRRSVEQVSRRTAEPLKQQLDALLTHNPGHPATPELQAMRTRIDQAFTVIPAVQTARYYAGNNAVRQARRSVRAGHLMERPEKVFGFVLEVFYVGTSKEASGQKLDSGLREARPIRGPGRVAYTDRVSSFLCRELSSQVPGLEKPWGAPCRKGVLSTWTKALSGRALYTTKGKMDPKALDQALTKLYVTPDTPMLGVTARDVYALYAPTVRVHLQMWKNIKRYGSGKLMRAYRAKLKATKKSGEHMKYVFYDKPERFEGLLEGIGEVKAWNAPGLFGFWLRRFDDGTEKVLIKHAKKVLKVYDPPLYKEIF